MDLEIRTIIIDNKTLNKIRFKQGIDRLKLQEVEWDISNKHGIRAVAIINYESTKMFVSLSLTNPNTGVWKLITAFTIGR